MRRLEAEGARIEAALAWGQAKRHWRKAKGLYKAGRNDKAMIFDELAVQADKKALRLTREWKSLLAEPA